LEKQNKNQTENNIQSCPDPNNVRYSSMKRKYDRPESLLEAISDLFDGQAVLSNLSKGIEKIERVTVEATRIKIDDEVDEKLLSWIAEEEGYSIEKGSFALRVIKEGMIIARVGSKSDVGGGFDLYIYLFPPEMDEASIYTKILAEREGVLDHPTGKINLEKFYEFNLKVIKMISKYRKGKYH